MLLWDTKAEADGVVFTELAGVEAVNGKIREASAESDVGEAGLAVDEGEGGTVMAREEADEVGGGEVVC
jgi:hypothetical protein